MLRSTSPQPTAAPTPEITDEPDKGNEGGDQSGDLTPEPGKDEPVITPGAAVTDASALFDPAIFEVSVSDKVFTKNYKSELEYFTLSAPAGKFVAAFTIDVKNISSQKKVFDYNNYDVQFQLVVNGDKSIGPEISLLSNDFRFTRSEIASNSVFSGVIVFFVDENARNLKLRFLGGSAAYELNYSAEVENGN